MRCFRDYDCTKPYVNVLERRSPKIMCAHDFVLVLDWREHANILFQEFSNNYDFVL
jgi:hypothetical protein